ncbi:sugar phosphate isomerase/epimerase family protein [Actinoplanes derwentensis]|uniref:Sugar phosphate isomerase/epimerase n=1 Tax=Actinoplanes derwentensis TaxID=113562 RepID=A0A1H1ZTZ3_9ACTN|nr:sugar phosphate isomerase/epimerase family protein [Actinoplanes derwentensis]GID83542.1 sugar phosphate isomerase [Actinoplanes derwentensis]SDT37291.1 Sugar phosphate isomerase/epimerase [Actinoplanes derwentensis]
MTIGLSTYAFFWQWHSTAPDPISLDTMLERTAALGVELFQICDYPLIEEADLASVKRTADGLGIALELGTRGLSPEHLQRYLDIAQRLDVTVVRSMFNTVGHRPSLDEAIDLLGAAIPDYERAGVTVALETYEQVPTPTVVAAVEAVGSANLGICLDPANSVAALEHPRDTIERTRNHVKNIHVKDFSFTRRNGWVGFTLAGCPLGEGLLDYDHMIDAVRPADGVNQIIEHWVPWQGDPETTSQLENRWTDHNLDYLRSRK